MDHDRTFRLTIPASDAEAFTEACRDVAWRAIDTGERIMTDDGPDAEAVVLVAMKKEKAALRAAAARC